MSNVRMLATPLRSVELFRPYLGDLEVLASTAMGLLLCVDAKGFCHVFDPETTEPEDVGFPWDEVMEAAARNPDIFDDNVRREALAALGPIADDEVYSLKVERVVGGKQVVSNMEISSLEDHLEKVYSIVEATKHDPVGTVYGAVRIVRGNGKPPARPPVRRRR